MFALFVVVWLGDSPNARASILLPDAGLQGDCALAAEQLVASLELDESAATDSASSAASLPSTVVEEEEPNADREREQRVAQQLAAMTTHDGSSTTGSSSSVNSGGNTNVASDLTFSAGNLPSECLVRRCISEAALLLPDAPGNQLLRPPQA